MDPTHHTKPTLVKKEEDVAVPHISSFPTFVANDSTISAEGHLSNEASVDGLAANNAPKPNKKEEAVTVPEAEHDTSVPRGTSQRGMSGVGVDPAIIRGLNPVASRPGASLSNDQRIWQGNLHVRGQWNEMVVPCVAIQYPTPDRPSVHDATGWPSQISCESSKLKQCASVFQYMNEPISQWYLQFAPVDPNGNETVDQKLVQLVKVMIQRQLAFEIQCNETPNANGTLYLWGMQMPPHGHSLLGVFRPGPSPVEHDTSVPRGVGVDPAIIRGLNPVASRPGAPISNGQRIWHGNLHVRGHRNDMVVPCVAIRYPTPDRPSVHDATGWPSRLHCDSSGLKQCSSVFQYMNEPISQWYVRFAPVDPNGNESLDQKLVQLVKVMIQRQLAFEIQCNETPSAMGTLYLWGMQMPPHGHSLLGVFRPGPSPVENIALEMNEVIDTISESVHRLQL